MLSVYCFFLTEVLIKFLFTMFIFMKDLYIPEGCCTVLEIFVFYSMFSRTVFYDSCIPWFNFIHFFYDLKLSNHQSSMHHHPIPHLPHHQTPLWLVIRSQSILIHYSSTAIFSTKDWNTNIQANSVALGQTGWQSNFLHSTLRFTAFQNYFLFLEPNYSSR